MMTILTSRRWFKDEHGRILLLRGANLGGSSKLPFTPDGATYHDHEFYAHRSVSFVGRPFPLAEADEHFSRLRAWGMTFLRFLVTWEAIEHAGPGQYDTDYLDYVAAILKKAHEYGIEVFIDPHQDVWSRWTGGDGAPGWTLEAVGMDLRNLAVTGAAISHQTHGDPFPRMIWPTNYDKLGAGTMFTLFFAGDEFAPRTQIDGIPVQEYLQSHYINAIKQVALRVRDLPNVVGYDSLNEPGGGWIGARDLSQFIENPIASGETPTPYQAMLLGAGYPQEVEVRPFGLGSMSPSVKRLFNADGVRLWREGYDCVWKQNGVWTDNGGEPHLLRPHHFALAEGKTVADDYVKPFITRFATEIRAVHPDAILFLEGVPGGEHPRWTAYDPGNAVNAAHWYDGLTLFTKMFNPEMTVNTVTREFVMGAEAVAASFVEQLGHQLQVAETQMNGIPTLIGEFGLPYDLNEKQAYRDGDFSVHETALDLYYDAMDANLLSCTIWNYTADNTNARGDLWNDEDLSIFSRDQLDDSDDVHAGGRGLRAIVRPYAHKTAGEPLKMTFEMATRVFEFVYQPDAAISEPTEIFVPHYQYRAGYRVEVQHARFEADAEVQVVRVWHSGDQPVTVRITPTP